MDQATGIFATRMGRATQAKAAKAKTTSTISAEDLKASAHYLGGYKQASMRWMDGGRGGWMDGGDASPLRCIDAQLGASPAVHQCMGGRMRRWKDGRMEGWMDGWLGG